MRCRALILRVSRRKIESRSNPPEELNMFMRLVFASCLFCSVSSLQAFAQATQPPADRATTTTTTTAPAGDARELIVTVTGVEGIVQVRADENAAWRKAETGMTLSQNAEF